MFKTISDVEFIDIAISQISYLRDDIIIHRIGADSKIADLIAPMWVSKKMKIVDEIDKIMNEQQIFQGDNI